MLAAATALVPNLVTAAWAAIGADDGHYSQRGRGEPEPQRRVTEHTLCVLRDSEFRSPGDHGDEGDRQAASDESRDRNIPNGTSGAADRLSMATNAAVRADARASRLRTVPLAHPWLCFHDGADEGEETEGDGECSAKVVGVCPVLVSGFAQQPGVECQESGRHRDVEEEDPAPTEGPGERATDQQGRGGSETSHSGPAGECFGALGAMGEHRHQDGQGGRGHHRR
jgi:hypothetical protein